MTEQASDCLPDWMQIAPQLDAAVAGLQAIDREAVLLRFFREKEYRTVGQILGLSEEAAKKRVSRALKKLRVRLEEKGVSLTESTLATAIAGVATQAAPIGLGKAIVAGSLAAVSVPSSASLAGTILRIMATSKTKAAAIAAMGVLSIPIAVLWMQNRDLRVEIDSLQEAVKQAALSPAATVPDGMALLDQNEVDRLRGNYRELLTLRGTVARLTKELRDLNTTPSQPEPETDEMIESSNLDSVLFTSASTNRVRSGSTLVAGGWSKDGMRGYMLITPTIHDVEDTDTEKPLAFRSRLVLAPEAFWEGIGWEAATSETRRSTLCGVLTPEETLTLYNLVKESGGGDISNESAATSQDGGYVGLGWSMPDESGPGMLMMIDLRPWIVAGSDEVDIELTPSAVPDDSVVHSSLRSEPQRAHNPGDHQD